jgi:hypothetical protein
VGADRSRVCDGSILGPRVGERTRRWGRSAGGLPLLDTGGLGAHIAAEAGRLTAAGPPRVSAQEIDDRRCAVTGLLEGLAGSRDESERLFMATELADRSPLRCAVAVLVLRAGSRAVGTVSAAQDQVRRVIT